MASLPSDRQALSSPLERSPCSGPRAGGSPAASLPLLLHCFCFFSSSFLLLLLLLLLLLQVILLPHTPTQNTCKEICMLLCSQQNTQDDSKRGATWRLVREPPAPCPLSPVPVPVPCSWLRPRSLAASASAQPCQHHVAAPPFCACHRARRPDAQRMKDTAPNWRGLPSLLPTNSTTDLPIVAAHGLPPSLPPPGLSVPSPFFHAEAASCCCCWPTHAHPSPPRACQTANRISSSAVSDFVSFFGDFDILAQYLFLSNIPTLALGRHSRSLMIPTRAFHSLAPPRLVGFHDTHGLMQ